jgi:predicted DNA-binding antitoxin AbrB/MazE fold protein
MAIHLEAVCERGVLRPLEPLALAEHQRVHVTVEDRNPPLNWDSAQPLDHSRAELDWVANESGHFAGEWVALDGDRLVAHGPKLAAVKAAGENSMGLAARTAKEISQTRSWTAPTLLQGRQVKPHKALIQSAPVDPKFVMEKARECVAKVDQVATSVERFKDAHASHDFETFVLREASCSSLVDQRQSGGQFLRQNDSAHFSCPESGSPPRFFECG